MNFDEVKAAQERVEQRSRRAGYLHVKSQVQRNVHDSDHTVDLTFQITPGPQFAQGKLDIVGLDLVSEPVIRKMWSLQPGKPFNVEYPDHFLARVKQDGIFDNLKNTRAETKVNSDEHTVARGFNLDDGFVRFNFEQGLAFANGLAFFLSPSQQLAIFLRHFERRHHHTDRHSLVFHEPGTKELVRGRHSFVFRAGLHHFFYALARGLLMLSRRRERTVHCEVVRARHH